LLQAVSDDAAAWRTLFSPQLGKINTPSALGTRDNELAVIFIPGDQLAQPKLVQLHFHVADVDAEYQRFKDEGVKFAESRRKMHWGWRHAYTNDPAGHTVELCSPLPEADFKQ
jgi:catechol 2,3-dioxygenase-like lactoylglutathione lyase family enzyme